MCPGSVSCVVRMPSDFQPRPSPDTVTIVVRVWPGKELPDEAE